ncbi:MAG: sigma-54-dependent transcriptional regulator [Planctomycetota bacterium]|jgi:two-component system nitrogen regulation response regulator NtrX
MPEKPEILIVDDQRAVREELAYALDYEGYSCQEAANGEDCLKAMAAGNISLVLLDIKMPGQDGLQVLAEISQSWPGLPVIMISGHGDIETAVVALKNGAYDFLPKPFDTDRVLVSVKNALTMRSLSSENKALRQELAASHRILGESPAVGEMRKVIERAAPTEAPVLILGENGTGKELVARQLHALSQRSSGPFVPLNCAAIPRELIESELFGHEKGAFTGATGMRRGHFESADGGTLLLDEIGDMALPAQAKLLRALQEKEITRVGGSKSIPVDVRVLAATNQDLKAMVEEKTFREDLFYRLHVIRVEVPALRERREDIEELAKHFLREACRQNGLDSRSLSKDGMAFLQAQSWPGNVRELKNLLEAAAILADEGEIDEAALRPIGRSASSPSGGDFFSLETLEEFRGAMEKEFIRRKLEENGGNIKRTAERISIQRSNLYKKLDRYGLK